MAGDPLEEGKQQLLLTQGPADLLDPLYPTKSHLVVELSVQPVRVVLRPPALLLTPPPHLGKVVINPGEGGQKDFTIVSRLKSRWCSQTWKLVTV